MRCFFNYELAVTIIIYCPLGHPHSLNRPVSSVCDINGSQNSSITHQFDQDLHKNLIFLRLSVSDCQKFCTFAVAIRKERMTYLLDSLSFTTTRKSNTCYWSCTLRAQISRIHVWFVVNREAYGEGLRLFAF
jgi:hypothetical protein